MAKTLWLLRHAKAVEHPPSGGRDRDRRLAPKGIADAEELGALIAAGAFGEVPRLALVSSAARTQATAQAAFGHLEGKVELETDQRLYRATPDDVLEIVRTIPDDIEIAAVVGHNPTIHCLAIDLVAEALLEGPHPLASRFPPGTLSIVSMQVTSWSSCSWDEGTLVTFHVPEKKHHAKPTS
jgi:phosphohistidine phosphatase